MDYSTGRYSVFDAQGSLIGRVDEDEFVRAPGVGGQLLYRLDGDELYDMQGGLVGHINCGQIIVAGTLKFRIESE
ncbi:MAG: hypothetical protein RJA63_237 [Pseudomonadota bacterium]|jgi:hypothetical protein